MAKMVPFFLIILFLFALSFSQSSANVTQMGTDLIHQTCNKTDYYDLCVSSLESDPRSTSGDLPIFATIFLELATSTANDTVTQISTLVNGTNDEQLKGRLLSACDPMYVIIMENMKEALLYMESKQYIEVRDSLWASSNQVVNCERSFTRPPPLESPIKVRSGVFENLCSIAHVILYQLT
ncbi:pectinesterase inhibitor-like [Tasmannia lanceolata]|uniref:pectinesterase inhibitor-like n=1 Tax=Tasmannia lanceolata TaxID=3420 RepID=UPI004063B1BA